MCTLEDFLDKPRDRDATKPSTHVLIVAVPEYQTLFDDEDLTSAAFSYRHLGQFWRDAATGSNCAFCPTPPVASVLGARLSISNASRGHALFSSVLAFLRELTPADTLIVHWIGHGSFLRKFNDHLLYLPNLQSPDDAETLEGVWLTRLTNWVGANCRARTQLFLLDCCSTEPSPLQALPEQFPRFIDNPERGPKQVIVIGSGVGRAARGRDKEPSIFTNSVIGALSGYAADRDGVVSTGRQFVTALASLAKAEWLTRGFPEFPNRALARGSNDWTLDFVQDVQPFCRYYTAQQDMAIARVYQPRVHCCLTFRDEGRRLRLPILEVDGGVELKPHRYLDDDNPSSALWVWVGDISPGRQFRVTLHDDDGKRIGALECIASRAVISESF